MRTVIERIGGSTKPLLCKADATGCPWSNSWFFRCVPFESNNSNFWLSESQILVFKFPGRNLQGRYFNKFNLASLSSEDWEGIKLEISLGVGGQNHGVSHIPKPRLTSNQGNAKIQASGMTLIELRFTSHPEKDQKQTVRKCQRLMGSCWDASICPRTQSLGHGPG